MNKKLDRDIPLLITGAGGVLGTALTSYLTESGFQKILAPKRDEMDLLDSLSVNSYFEKHQPRVVIHLAATVFGLGGNLKHQMRSIMENTLINNNVFAALLAYPASRVFFAGTVASYPVPYRQVPLMEEDFFDGLPHGGEFGYAMAKRHAYAYLKILSEEVGTDFTYGIFTNLYGENDRFDENNGHVIPSLIVKAHEALMHHQVLNVWGDGSAKRDFLHAYDAARAVLLCLEGDSQNSLINISSAEGTSIRRVAEVLTEIAGIKGVYFDDEKPVGIPSRIVNNQRLLNLGFSPSISINEGLVRSYQWYVSNLENIRK